ncbi:hypothetical protein [Naasia lichenicola]|uniref:Uncharacterized protein n=1 Tax=Naasia lichenicola TaxID=2565933 RepID=A0A4S4FRJ3_9MICO|nr:hypothetical protein [Naasia lichenicola]THG33269.1 hypothetical protein E6C64_02645 [Naasia lichenicola]
MRENETVADHSRRRKLDLFPIDFDVETSQDLLGALELNQVVQPRLDHELQQRRYPIEGR